MCIKWWNHRHFLMILTPSFNTTVSAVKTILDNGGGGCSGKWKCCYGTVVVPSCVKILLVGVNAGK